MAGVTSFAFGVSKVHAGVEMHNIDKSFGGVKALSDVSLRIEPGTVHALVGENGAGKSTLSRICGGVLRQDGGQIVIDGHQVSFHSPKDALAYGIATIAQELALVPQLSVSENVFLGAEPRSVGFINSRELRDSYRQLCELVGFDLPHDIKVGDLRTADQQKVEIMRALSRGASLIIMDEPTAALSQQDTQHLHHTIRSLASEGRTVVFISHFLSEVLSLSDTVTILRDGRHIRTSTASQESESTLIEGMLGRSLGSVYPDKPVQPDLASIPILSAKNIYAPGVNGVSIDVAAGEIVGIAGLVGAGRTELARAIYGSVAINSGSIEIQGKKVTLNSPKDGLRHGIAMIPESRKEEGLIPLRSVAENVSLPKIKRFSRFALVSRTNEARTVHQLLEGVTVKTSFRNAAVSNLSGGNQQKVLFARAFLCSPKILIADEPTRGVDVGSRRAIYELIKEFALGGGGVIVISSDVEEVLALSHRVIVMRGGRVAGELIGDQLTEEQVLKGAFSEIPKDC